jgi:signal transduction histidine kinase
VLATLVALSHLAATEVLRREWDQSLTTVNELTGRQLAEEDHAGSNLNAKELAEDVDEYRPAGVRIEMRDHSGALVAAVGGGPNLAATGGGCASQGEWRVCEREVGGWQLRSGRSRAAGLALRNRFVAAIAGAALLVGLVVGVLTRAIVGRAMAPFSRISERISSLRLGSGQRVGLDNPRWGELATLAGAFDELLARMDEALARERRFAAEASHELKTPLTVLRAEVEALAAREADGGTAGRALRSVDALIGLVESLLWLAHAQTPLPSESLEVINLADLVREQAAQACRAVPHAGRRVEVAAPDELLIKGNERLLARALANLLDNALKYSPAIAPVRVNVRHEGEDVLVEVADGGSGISVELERRVFEPFFRGGRERAATAGFGLGLPLARAVARAHRGDVLLVDTSSAGTSFLLRLPEAAT